tara:strand:- start:21919 stop:22059 length:141 start_codon:yes stop_codon:yes gene_type:complete
MVVTGILIHPLSSIDVAIIKRANTLIFITLLVENNYFAIYRLSNPV